MPASGACQFRGLIILTSASDTSIVRLRLPPLRRVADPPEIVRLEERLRERGKAQRSFMATFGLELKAANLIALDGHECHREILQRFLSRPAFEPILLHMWKGLTTGRAEPEFLAKLASGFAGKSVGLAVGNMRTRPSPTGKYTVYAPPEHRLRLTSALEENAALEHSSPLARAIIAFALTVICHPLTDGNGRVARAILLGSLARDRIINAPIVPLGPAFYLHGRLVGDALARLSDTGDWTAAVAELAQILTTACDLAEGVDRLT